MLDEAPETLIFSTKEGFETQPDVDSIGRINESARKINELWQNEEKRLENAISALENELQATRVEIEHLRQPTSEVFESLHLSREQANTYRDHIEKNGEKSDVFGLIHEQTALLDISKISLAKQLSELETTIMQMRASEMRLARRETEIAEQKAAALASNTSSNVTSTTMKIMLFKKFGIHIDMAVGGGNDKVVIFSEKKSEPAKVLEVDPKFSDYFISNYIWESIGNTEEP